MSGAVEGGARPRPWPALRGWLASAPALRLVAVLCLRRPGSPASPCTRSSRSAGRWPGRRRRCSTPIISPAPLSPRRRGLLVMAVTAARARDCALDRARLGGPSPVAAALVMVARWPRPACSPPARPLSTPSRRRTPRSNGSPPCCCSSRAACSPRIFARDFARRRSAPVLALAGLLAAAFFVLGMEEISWMQRIFGFGTPERLAELNWQAEFNFHNMQTDLSELVYYAGAGLFLSVLPLLRGAAPPALARHPLAAFVPDRGVAAVAAPAAIFTFGQWNLLPVQLACWLALFVAARLRACGAAAGRRPGGPALPGARASRSRPGRRWCWPRARP